MADSVGIKESKEAITGMMEVSLVIADVLKDGAQLGDLASVVSRFSIDKELKDEMGVALDNISKVPHEMSDLNLQESLELAMLLISYVPKFVEIFRRA